MCHFVRKIYTPLNNEVLEGLKAGDIVSISGIIYSARDAAHRRLIQMIENGLELPISLEGQIIYYLGPCPPKENQIIGSAGPTTSSRMDIYTPALLKLGLKGMIGKGNRNDEVVQEMMKHKAVYFAAVGGAGALISKCIKEQRIVAFEDLDTEAIRELKVEEFPATVAIDLYGNNLYVRYS